MCSEEAAMLSLEPMTFDGRYPMLTVLNVPVINCRLCHESYLTAEALRRLDSFLATARPRKFHQ
jgi:hypothetical protein